MLANDQLAGASTRRIRAEADEITLRAAHRRRPPVLDAQPAPRPYPIADMAEIVHDPENGRLPLIGVLGLLMVLIVLFIAAAGLILIGFSAIDWGAAMDWIAPTAAQARDAGWVALSEGL